MTTAGSSPALERARSISSCVRFLDWRKATLFSTDDCATEGSCRTGGKRCQTEFGIKGTIIHTCDLVVNISM